MTSAFGHWSASWPVLAGYAVLAAWHLTGLRRLRGQAVAEPAGPGRPELRREAVLYQLGLLVVMLSLVSPIGSLSVVYIWVRTLQELLVAIVGPGLIVLGAPWNAFRAALSRSPLAAGSRPPRWLTAQPVLMVIAANAVWLVWQFPALFDRAQSGAGLALLEHVSYVAAGLAFWAQVISSRPYQLRTPPLRRISLVIGSAAAATVFGMMLVFGSGVLYPAYVNSAHHLLSVLDDQQLAGAVWWMGILPPMIVAAVALMMEWLSNEESAELSAGLDRLLVPRRHGWPSRPVIR
jgi:putative membrane protein